MKDIGPSARMVYCLLFTVKVYTLTYRIFFSAGESLYFCKNIINI